MTKHPLEIAPNSVRYRQIFPQCLLYKDTAPRRMDIGPVTLPGIGKRAHNRFIRECAAL